MEAGRPAATQSPRPSCGDLSSAEPRRAFVVGRTAMAGEERAVCCLRARPRPDLDGWSRPGGRPRQRNWTCKKEKKETPPVGTRPRIDAEARGGVDLTSGAGGGRRRKAIRRAGRSGHATRAPRGSGRGAPCACAAPARGGVCAPGVRPRTVPRSTDRLPNAPTSARHGAPWWGSLRRARGRDRTAERGISPVPTAWMHWGLSRVAFATFVSLFG
jgi:hypothetical protein